MMDGQWADDQLTFATTTILCVESRDREVRAVGVLPMIIKIDRFVF